MRSLRMLAGIVVVLALSVSVAQAQIAYFYVANSTANLVSVYNSGNDTFIENVSVGTSPWGVAVNQAGTAVYVTNNGSNTVSVISTSTNKVVATIPVGTAPFGVAFTPDGTRAFVANGNSNSVSVINPATKKVTATVAVGNHPIGLAVLPNGTFVYVTNSVSGTVSVISTLTNKVVATIPVGIQPYAVALSPNGATAWVTNAGSNTVSVIQTATNTVVNTISVSPGPAGAAVSPDGQYLYVANSDNNEGNLVTIINTGTQSVQTTVVVGTGPQQITFTEDSEFATVTNIASNNLSVIYTPSMTVVVTYEIGPAPIGSGIVGLHHVSTVVGGYVGDGGSPLSAVINGPYSSAYDKAGNLYISDYWGNRIRKVDPTGTEITTYAGTGICGYNGDNIPSTEATLCYPNGLLFDSAGDLIVEDGNCRIRKIAPKGTITTIAGNGVCDTYSGDGGPALDAAIGQPFGITYDAAGNLYFADVGHCVVRKVSTSGIITTVAGTGTCGYNSDGIPATAAQLNMPRGVAFYTSGYGPESCGPQGCQKTGNLYIADTLNCIVREVSPAGIISTFAGIPLNCGFSGENVPAATAMVNAPAEMLVQNGVLYFADRGNSLYRYVNLSTNIINTLAGSGNFGYDGDGHSLLATEFAGNTSMLFDASGNPVFDDSFNGRVRKATGGIVNTIAGGFIGDGNEATSAGLALPEALAIDSSGNIYIAEETGNRVRKVSGGKISTLAGSSVSGYSGDGGPAINALLNGPQGVAVDSSGNVFIADTGNDVIRKVDTSGNISTFATNSNFCYLQQMATDSGNNLYVADSCNSVIFKITPAGVVTILAGVLGECGYNGNDIPATTAQLCGPEGVAVDPEGNVYIADTYNNLVRVVNGSGVINTIAGDSNCSEAGDGGPATAAELCNPYSVALSSSGTIYIVDEGSERIRQISGGIITAFAGSEEGGFNGDGLWPLLTSFSDLVAVAVDSTGAVYVLDDAESHRVRKIQ
jgi:YVTN family beta-propeller protein